GSGDQPPPWVTQERAGGEEPHRAPRDEVRAGREQGVADEQGKQARRRRGGGEELCATRATELGRRQRREDDRGRRAERRGDPERGDRVAQQRHPHLRQERREGRLVDVTPARLVGEEAEVELV